MVDAYQKAREVEEEGHTREMKLKLLYWNIASASPMKWIEESARVQNGRLYLYGNSLGFLRSLLRKFEVPVLL